MINSVIAGLFLLHLELSYLLLMRQPLLFFCSRRVGLPAELRLGVGSCVKILLPGTEVQGLAGSGEQRGAAAGGPRSSNPAAEM